MNLQKKLATKILKCGENRVWIDPKNEKVSKAITRKDIRRFIKEGAIKKLPEKKRAKAKVKRQQMVGSRKGTRKARVGEKTNWLNIIRPQRKLLKELRENKKIEPRVYRKTYRLVKGGLFKSKSRLMSYLKEKRLMKE